jgi:para-nitrobenzyl esterase
MRTDRRNFVRTLGAGFVGTSLGLCFTEKLFGETIMQSGEVTANTKYGKIRGTILNDVGVFRGIPYAGPSDGPNRFLSPTPLAPWAGIKEATAFGPKSYQSNTSWIDQSLVMRENCEYLNIWTPSVKSGKKLPVMFWNHGGGFSGGPSVIDGLNLAKTGDVIVVTHTHRLNLFGYLYLGHLNDKYAQSGNAGMLDILAALRWVKENITEFGGDPDNITIFGQSGGGAKVAMLMTMPMASGMFHKAIIQSGPSLSGTSKEKAISTTETLFKNLGLKVGDIESLLKLPAQTLIDKGIPSLSFGPVVDSVVLPTEPFSPEALKLSANIPLIVGTCREEQGRPPKGNTAILGAIRKMAGDDTDKLLAIYEKNYPERSLEDIFYMLNAELTFRGRSYILAERNLQKPAPVYMYRFDYGEIPEGGMSPRSKHTGEVAFIFNNIGEQPTTDPAYIIPTKDTAVLAENLSKTWAAFAYNGNPDHAGLPHWPTYDLKDRSTMIFDVQCNVANDPDGEIREIITGSKNLLKL